MKACENKTITFAITLIGVVFILFAVFLVFAYEITSSRNAKNAKNVVPVILSLMPEATDGVLDDRVNKDMPALEVEGENFVGIVDVPAYSVSLPVKSAWDKWDVLKYPCRYEGSIYEENLIIGGCDNEGQFDFLENISIGDSVFITDVTGARYSYAVSDIKDIKKASKDEFYNFEYDVLLFSKKTFGKGYTVAACKFKNKLK